MAFERISTHELRPSQLIFSANDLGPSRTGVRLQAAYSMAIAALAALAAAPLMLLVAGLVKLTSPGPALLRQRRVGRNNCIFTLYKFRSMVQDAEAHSGPVWATHDDPRVTPVGRWLRKLRLDELPQLFNVLKGDMSLIGPRPLPVDLKVEGRLCREFPHYPARHRVRPGLTGLAQVNGWRGGIEVADDLEKRLAALEL